MGRTSSRTRHRSVTTGSHGRSADTGAWDEAGRARRARGGGFHYFRRRSSEEMQRASRCASYCNFRSVLWSAASVAPCMSILPIILPIMMRSAPQAAAVS